LTVKAFPLGQSHVGIKMADSLEGLLPHQVGVVGHILRQPLRTKPTPGGLHLALDLGVGMDWRAIGEPPRYLQHGLVDHDGHRIKVAGHDLKTQSLGL
jgi:hypothetical protein